MENNILDETIEILIKQMIIDNFKNKNSVQEKFIITKQELYEFSIKLIKLVKGVYDDNG